MIKGMALSVRQPWASLIINGLKTIEVRSWSTDYRGRILIHASRTPDENGMQRFPMVECPLGAIIGSVELISVEKFTNELWYKSAELHLQSGGFHPELYAWHIANQNRIETPIYVRGALKLFYVELSNDPTTAA